MSKPGFNRLLTKHHRKDDACVFDVALQSFNEAIWAVVTVTGPILGIALGIGLLVGIFQAATQIQEMTLSFLPKAAAIAGVLFFGGPWFLHVLIQFTTNMFQSAGSLHP